MYSMNCLGVINPATLPAHGLLEYICNIRRCPDIQAVGLGINEAQRAILAWFRSLIHIEPNQQMGLE